tara:strand:- start:227 stop:340 length:114 start_codon:yes stop_codon:yes gene_type:complete
MPTRAYQTMGSMMGKPNQMKEREWSPSEEMENENEKR